MKDVFAHLRGKPVDLEKLRSVGVAGSAMPTRAVAANRIAATEERWEKDIPAYKRLRRDGLQPKKIDGCADLESRASAPHQVEGKPDPKAIERVGNL